MFKLCAIKALFLSFTVRTLAQSTSDAYVKIANSQGLSAGSLGIYEFTVEVYSGTVIQIYLPSQLSYSGDISNVSICYEKQLGDLNSQPLKNCTFNQTLNMVQFLIPQDYQNGGYLSVGIGQFLNPPQSMLLTGFLIQIFDSSSNLISQSDPAAVYVQILPNLLTLQSLQVGSNQIAAQTSYLFSFQVTNPVPAIGGIQIIFPTSQIPIPLSAPSAQISLDGGNTWNSVQTTQITQTSLTFGLVTQVAANGAVQLKVNQLTNPNTMAQTLSFTISTIGTDQAIIDQVSTGLTVTCTVPATLNITSISISSRTVGATTSATFKISLPIRYQPGGYLLINLPNTVSLNSTSLLCLLLIGFVNDMGQCLIQNATQLKIFDTINQPQLTFSVSGIQNPPNTQPTQNFLIQAFDPLGNLIASNLATPSFGYTPTPGTILSATSVRSNNIVGQATNITVSFKNQNILQTGQLVQVIIPLSHFLTTTNTISCQAGISSESSTSSVVCSPQISSSNITVTYAVNCANRSGGFCNSGTQFTLIVSGMQNLLWISSNTQSVQITTMTSDQLYQIDQIKTGVSSLPSLVAGSLNSLTLANTPGGIVGVTTSLQVSLTTQNSIPVGGYLNLQLQDQSFQPPTSGLLLCVTQSQSLSCSFTKYSSGYINTITIYQPWGTSMTCPAGSTISFSVSSQRNPKSVNPIINQFTFQTLTSQNQLIDQGVLTTATGLQISAANITSLTLLQPLQTQTISTGAATTYQLQIIPNNGIEPTLGKLVINLPVEINLKFASCSAVVQQTVQSLQCSLSEQTLEITHSIQNANFAGQTIVVTCNNFINPTTTKPTQFVSATTYLQASTSNSVLYMVEKIQDSFNIIANTPNQLKGATVTRSFTQVNSPTSIIICITPYNPLPAQSTVTITFPQDQIVVGQGVPTSNVTIQSFSGQQIVFQFTQLQAASVQVCFSLNGNITNAQSTKNSVTSVQILTQTVEGYLIDQMTNNLFTTPFISSGPFQSIQINQQNTVVGQQTNIQTVLQLSTQLIFGNTLQLILPASTFYTSSNIQCIFQQQIQNCLNSTNLNDAIGTYITSIYILIPNSYFAGQTINFTVTNLVNKYTSNPTQALINVAASDAFGNTISQSSYTLNIALTPNYAGTLKASRSQLTVQKSTNINIVANLQTRLQSNSQVQISLAQSLVSSVQSPSILLNNNVVSSSMTQSSGNYVIAFLVPQMQDNSILNISILGFYNQYSTDVTTDGIQIQTSVSGYLIDQINQTQMIDQLIATSVSISQFALNNYVVGQRTNLSLNLSIAGYANQNNVVQIKNISQSFYKSNDFQLLFNGNVVQSQSTSDQYQFLTSVTFSLPSICQTSCLFTLSNLINKDDTSPLNLYFTTTIQTTTEGTVAFGNSQFTNQNVLQPPQIPVSYLNRSSQLPATNTQIYLGLTLPSVKNIPSTAILNLIMPSTDINIAQPNICQTEPAQQCQISQVNSSFIQLQMQNICFSGCQGDQNITIHISNGFLNPASLQVTNLKYQLQLLNGNNLIAQTTGGFSLQPSLKMNITMGLVSIGSLVNQIVGSLTNVKIDIVLGVDLQKDILLLVQLPASTFYITSNLQCQSQQCQNTATQTDQIGTYYTSITMVTSRAYDSGQTLTIMLQNLQNKFSTYSVIQSQVQITVQNAFGSATCQSSGNLSITYLPNNIGSAVANRNNLLVQQATIISLQVNLQTRLQANSQMSISLPKSIFFQTSTLKTTSNGQLVSSNLSQNQTSYLLMFNLQAQPDMALLVVTIQGFTNRYSTDQQSEGISINTSFGGNLVDIIGQTQLSDTLLPTTTSISSYTLSNTFVGQNTTVDLAVQLSGYALQNDVIILQFLGQNNYVSGQVGVNFNGQLVQSTQRQDQNGYLTSLTFLLPSKLQNQAIVQISGLINRDSIQPVNFDFDIQIMSNTGGQIAVGQSKFLSQNVLKPTQFTVSSLIRNSQIAGNQIQLSLNLTLPSVKNVPNDAQLLLLIPSTELLVATGSTCQTNTQAICTFKNLNSSYISLTLTDICKQGCISGSNLQITVYSGASNPINTQVTTLPYDFQFSSGGYLIAQQVGGAVIYPPIIQNVTISNFALYQSSVIAGDSTTFSINFALDYSVTQVNIIQIGIPSYTFIVDNKIAPQCQLYGYSNIDCKVTQSQTLQDSPTFATMIQLTIMSGSFTANVNQTIVISGFRNTDCPRLRSSNNMFSLTMINSLGTIIASNIVSESQLTDFTVASISNFNITRATVQTGQQSVRYLLQFQVQNYIKVGEYFQINFPLDQAQIDQRMLICREPISGYNVLCQIQQGQQQILYVNQWCSITNNQQSQLCQPNVTMSLEVYLSNPSTFSALPNPVTISLLTQDAVQKANNQTGTYVSPGLTGIQLNNVTLQRLNNTVGTKETLQLRIGSIDSSIIVSTDIILNLPDGTQIQPAQQNLSCQRNTTSQNSQLQCYVSKTFASGSIQQITIKNFCSQSLLCLKTQSFLINIQNVINPSTNQKVSSSLPRMVLQQGNVEVAFGNITIPLVKMTPAQVYISTQVSNNCTTMAICQLNVTLMLTNPLQSGNFVTFVSPLSFQSLSCKVQSILTPINCIVINTNSIKLLSIGFVNNTTPIKFSIYSVAMPQNTASVTNFQATSYETLNGVSSMLDNATGGNITVSASQFSQVNIVRLKSTLGQTTDIQVQFLNPQQVSSAQFLMTVPTTQALLTSQSVCSSSNSTVQCNINYQTIAIKSLRVFCPSTMQICKLTVSNVMNPNGVFIGSGSQSQVQLQLLTISGQNDVYHQILQGFFNVTPTLSQQNFTLSNANIQPSNSYTAQLITISFQFTLQRGPGQFMQISFDKSGYAPIYSELQKIQVSVNNEVVEIVNIQTTQTGWYWAPIQELTFSLPPGSFGQNSKVVLSGITNPHMQNNQNNKAILKVMYLYSDLSALASSSIVIPVQMVPSLVSPITAYSKSPYILTQTFIDVSFGLQNNTVYSGNISIQLPQAFQLQKVLNCSELLTQKNISCFTQSQNSVIIPFNQTQSYTGFSLRIGAITNPAFETTAQFKILIFDSQGIYSQGSFDLSVFQQGQICSENCQQCTSQGVCTDCSKGFVLNGESCSLVCQLGQFALQGYCFQCQSQCLACQRQDQCSVCNQDQVILSGLCLSDCPSGYLVNNQSQCQIQSIGTQSDCDGTARKTYYQNTVNDTDFANTNITYALQSTGINQTNNPFFFCQNVLNQSICSVKNCSRCGLISSMCQQCANEMVIFDGTCVNNCPSGYFVYEKQCYKCSSACQNCQGSASHCIDCKEGLLYSPKIAQCKQVCSSGYFYHQNSKSCISCDTKCNTCDVTATNCTSCLMDIETNADLFLSNGNCVRQCPSLQSEDLQSHKCIQSAIATSSLIWCLPLCCFALIVSFGFPVFSKGNTKYISLNTVQVATAFVTTFDFLNKLGLLVSLWPSQNLGCFVVIGVNILLTSLLGIYESHIVQVQERPKLLKIISQVAGPQLTRLFLSNFLALFKINLTTSQQPINNQQEYERCCLAQSVLVIIQMLNSVAILALSSPQQFQFGLAVNNMILGTVSLSLHAIIIRNSRVAPVLAKQVAE